MVEKWAFLAFVTVILFVAAGSSDKSVQNENSLGTIEVVDNQLEGGGGGGTAEGRGKHDQVQQQPQQQEGRTLGVIADLFLSAHCFSQDCQKSPKRAEYCCSRHFNIQCCAFGPIGGVGGVGIPLASPPLLPYGGQQQPLDFFPPPQSPLIPPLAQPGLGVIPPINPMLPGIPGQGIMPYGAISPGFDEMYKPGECPSVRKRYGSSSGGGYPSGSGSYYGSSSSLTGNRYGSGTRGSRYGYGSSSIRGSPYRGSDRYRDSRYDSIRGSPYGNRGGIYDDPIRGGGPYGTRGSLYEEDPYLAGALPGGIPGGLVGGDYTNSLDWSRPTCSYDFECPAVEKCCHVQLQRGMYTMRCRYPRRGITDEYY